MLNQLEFITSLDLLRDIIQNNMNLKDDRLFIYGQEYNLPTDKNLFVNIEFKYSKPYSNRNLTPINEGNISEEQNLNTQEFLTVQLFSRNFEALRRKEEAVMALKSVYAQQLQEKYTFRLSWNAQILDLSSLEATAMLYRYDVPVVVLTAYQKTKSIEWFNSYSGKVIANEGNNTVIEEFDQSTESF